MMRNRDKVVCCKQRRGRSSDPKGAARQSLKHQKATEKKSFNQGIKNQEGAMVRKKQLDSTGGKQNNHHRERRLSRVKN